VWQSRSIRRDEDSPWGHRIDEQRQQHARVIAAAAPPAQLGQPVKPGGIQPLDRLDQEPHQVLIVQPVDHAGRQQELLLPVHRPVRLRHTGYSPKEEPIRRNDTPISRVTSIRKKQQAPRQKSRRFDSYFRASPNDGMSISW